MKKVMIIFPKDSEAMFNPESKRTFGGASVQMYLFSKELKKIQNLDVFSMTCDYENINFKEDNSFKLVRNFKESDNFLTKIIKTHKTISKIKPDIIIQQGLTNESCLMALYCFIIKIKFVFIFAHDVEVQKKFQSSGKRCHLFNLLMKYSSMLIVQNKFQHDLLKMKFTTYMKKVLLLYNGFPFKKQRKKKGKSILWVARSDKWKRPELFIKLASFHPKIKFTMICSNSGDDGFYQDLINISKNLENIEFIQFMPFNKIDKYFKKAFLFVNTSDHEGYPQTYIQALMNSVPIFSLNVNPDDFITSYNCGKVFHGDFNSMSEEINKIFKNLKLYNKLSDNAYNYFLTNHNIRLNVSKLATYFDF